VTLRSADDPAWKGVELPADVRVRIGQDLAAGNVVVVPTKPIERDGHPSFAWWRVDATTGRSLGMTAQGGATMTERALLTWIFIGQTITGYAGCVGAGGASPAKAYACLGCAVAVSALATIGFAGEAGAMTGKVATWAAGTGGAGAGIVVGSFCNVLTGLAVPK
jgi:hypothetical protein